MTEFDPSIDEYRLDSEWTNQPRMYHRYAKRLADARRLVDEAKNRLEVVKAELDLDIRSNPGRYGIVKVTEATVASAIVVSGGYKTAMAEVLDAKHNADILSAAVTALDHRKRALENLVQLHCADYYASPRSSDSEMEEVEKRAIRRRGQRKVNA